MSRWRNSWPKRSRESQRGSLIVTTFVIIVGLTMVLAGVNFLLKEQMRQSLEIKTIALGRLQAFYLAEMGVNEFMSQANLSGNLPPVPRTYDLKNFVAMTRSDASGVAQCTVTDVGGGKYRVTPTLQTSDGPFDIPYIITFTPSWDATDNMWELAAYEIGEKP